MSKPNWNWFIICLDKTGSHYFIFFNLCTRSQMFPLVYPPMTCSNFALNYGKMPSSLAYHIRVILPCILLRLKRIVVEMLTLPLQEYNWNFIKFEYYSVSKIWIIFKNTHYQLMDQIWAADLYLHLV